MATEQDYRLLNEKIKACESRRLTLEAQERVKAEKRDALMAELAAAGIDTNNLLNEAVRIQSEIDVEYDRASSLVAEFEKKLTELTEGVDDSGRKIAI